MDNQIQPPQQPHTPEPPVQKPGSGSPEFLDLKSAQNFILAGSIAGLVSFFIGGIFAAGAGLGFAIVAFRKLKKLTPTNEETKVYLKRLKWSSITTMVICSISIVMRIIQAFMLYPVVMEALESGDLESLYAGTEPSVSPDAPKGSSTWG